MKATFPSIEWFQALQKRMNEQEEKYKLLGFVDARGVFGVKGNGSKDRYFGAVFDTYDCAEVKELSQDELKKFDYDWIFEGDYADWKEMLQNIKANGHADADHSLNRLSLLKHPFRIHGDDQMRVDMFYRLQATFQEFMDDSAVIDTVYEK